MKIDLEKLQVRPCDPHIDSLPHMKACKGSKGYLENFLSWGLAAPYWSIKQHTIFLLSNMKDQKTYQTYVANYEGKFAGLFSFGDGMDIYGGQICYWVPREFAGRGIATEVTDFLSEVAFIKYGWTYVVLHVDKMNVGSNRVAEKSGFHLLQEYECEKQGIKGSGEINLWVRYSPDLLESTKAERLKVFESNEAKPRSSWHLSGIERMANDIFNNPDLVPEKVPNQQKQLDLK